jgi:hypothetical protein
MWDSPIYPGEHKPVQPLGSLIHPSPNKTEKQTVICNQTHTEEGAGGTLNLPQRKGQGKELSVNKHWATSNAGQVVDHRNDLLNQKAAVKTELPHLTEGFVDHAAAGEG